MREIKFRVWDTQLYVMYTDEKDKELGDAYEPLWRLECKRGGRISYPLGIIMQFTGLKDKNGKEIYENDICQIYEDVNSNSNKAGQMLYDKSIIKMDNGSITYTYPSNTGIIDLFLGMLDTEKNLEVIGNLYENPELL